MTPPQVIGELVDGPAARGALRRMDAVLAGYAGDLATEDAILDAMMPVQVAHPGAIWCRAPAIGDRRSANGSATQAQAIGNVRARARCMRRPRLPVAANGGGDLTAPLFLCHDLVIRSSAIALRAAAPSARAVPDEIRIDWATDRAKLALIAARRVINAPAPWMCRTSKRDCRL